MASSFKSICKELDGLTLSYLDKLNEYTHEWKTTSNEFQQGFLDLAYAKYTMGATIISHYSYDEHMKAILQVEIDDKKTLYLKNNVLSEISVIKDKKDLRNRKIKDIELNEKKIKNSGDPLYWFGLFVSPSLRTSQEHFKSATEQLIHQMNRIIELKSIEKRYHELQGEKLVLKLKQTTIQ